jgi:DNA-binding transcriptional ArsR family regulator
MTKNSPAVATGAHISIIGHITKLELLRNLTSTEAANGFGNRFLWCCVKRSKFLPEGGTADDLDFDSQIRDLTAAVQFARETQEICRDDEARQMWADVYPQLSEGKPGLLGAMIARAEAQTMRLACLYALLDRSSVIRADHLLAAVALWTYCEDSARWIFGDVLGDPVADEILRSLRRSPKGMTRTEIARLFSNHREKQELARALALLLEEGLVSYEKESTGGRPGERWRATTQGCEKSERSEETPAEDPSFA